MKPDQGRGARGERPGVVSQPGTPHGSPTASQGWRTIALADQTIAIPDDPLCAADADDAANRLLADYAAFDRGDHVLVLGAGCGLLAAYVAPRIAPTAVILSDTHSVALERAVRTLQRNSCTNYMLLAAERLTELEAGGLDAALVNSAFQASNKALAEALRAIGRALRPGGRIYVAGAKARGIGAIKARLAEIFGAASTLGYRKGVHVVAATRPESWADAPAAPLETIAVTLRGHTFQLRLRDGVFARGGLDDGTCMLIEAMDVRSDDHALDLGCGGGIIGMLLARLAPHGQIELVDSDSAAVALARDNLQANGIVNATAYIGDGVGMPPREPFDLIATNPPFHFARRQTTAIAHRFIADAVRALRRGGRFYLVANRFLPYERDIEASFGNVCEVAGDGRYKVLLAQRDS